MDADRTPSAAQRYPGGVGSANPCALLASAAWAADDRELQAIEREDFARSREWREVAAEIRRVWDLALEAARPRSFS